MTTAGSQDTKKSHEDLFSASENGSSVFPAEAAFSKRGSTGQIPPKMTTLSSCKYNYD